MRDRKIILFLFCSFLILLFNLPVAAQNQKVKDEAAKKVFSNINEEIKYYLTEETYRKRHYDVISPNDEAIARVRTLLRENKSVFLEEATKQFIKADAAKVEKVIYALLQASHEEIHPLNILITEQSLKETFSGNKDVITKALNDYIKNVDREGCEYVIETLGSIKYYAAIPNITRMLYYYYNPNFEITIKSLLELNANNEITEFTQLKVLEEICNKKGGLIEERITKPIALETLQKLVELNPGYSQQVKSILQKVAFEPDEKQLIKIAIEGRHERVRGLSIRLIASYKTDDGLNVILDLLKKDKINLIRHAAANSLGEYSNPKAIDALIEAYHTDKDHGVRLASIESLGIIGGEKAEVILREALDDPSSSIRDMAKFRLKQLESRKN